jgi:uncharacterized Rmd1/YagE family protein
MLVEPMSTVATSTPSLVAAALSRRLRLTAVSDRLGGEPERQSTHGLVLRRADGTRVHLFAVGAVVVEGAETVPDDLERELVERLDARLLRETEEPFRVVTDPSAPGVSVDWDGLVLPQRSATDLDVIALVLARSAALERHELAMKPLLDEAETLVSEIGRRGRPLLRARRSVRRVAGLAQRRLELARWFFLVDRPETAWEDPAAARLFDQLFDHLELEPRHEALLHQLTATESTLETVLDLWQVQRSHFLEWLIIVLIALEIVLLLVLPGEL